MTQPQVLRLTPNGVEIVVRRKNPVTVAMAARVAVGLMTMDDVLQLESWSSAFDREKLIVVVLADWIAWALDMDKEERIGARHFANSSTGGVS